MAVESKSTSRWSDEELSAAVEAYVEMLSNEARGQLYAKSAYRRALIKGRLRARSDASVEYRMRNISSVLEELGRPILMGYRPAHNVGASTRARLRTLLAGNQAAAELVRRERQDPPPMIYFNIGWMEKYRGMADDDPTLGAHGFLHTHKHGAESFNFLPTRDGRVEGYRPGEAKRLAIEKLGASRNAESVSGVLVIWLARETVSGRTMIVGWYENATAYARARPGSHADLGGVWDYSVEAAAVDAHLVPPIARNFWVQSARTSPGQGFGQSTTWYGTIAVDQRVWNYVRSVRQANDSPPVPRSGRPPRNLDPELRRKVEKAAVDHATRYFKSSDGGSCRVTTVEALAKGWDLEVANAANEWLVEVKGLQGSALICELTPNEYQQMKSAAHSARYVLYVVNNALEAPIASVFYNVGKGTWQTADGRSLEIDERVAAILRAS